MAIKGPASVRIIAGASWLGRPGRPTPNERLGLPSYSRRPRRGPDAAPASRLALRRTGGPRRRAETPIATSPKPGPHAPVSLPGCHRAGRFSCDWTIVIHYLSIVILPGAIVKPGQSRGVGEKESGRFLTFSLSVLDLRQNHPSSRPLAR